MWMRIDDGLHAHRKTRAVTKSHPDKFRDAAPMGLWALAGSWSGRNNREGWVPCEELDRFDDDWEVLAKRLVTAGFWWPEQRDGEDGYGFNDWEEWNNPTGPSASGTFGNHVRWHVNKGLVKEDCEHCPSEPDNLPDEPEYRPDSHPTRPDHRPDIAPDSGSESGGESLRDHRPDSLTRPDPSPTRTQPKPPSADTSASADARFDDFWTAYDKKSGRKRAHAKYRLALKKPGVTPELLIERATTYVMGQRAKGKHPEYTKDPATWLNGEHWEDEIPEAPHLIDRRVVNAPIEEPPDGLSDAEMSAWYAQRRRA